MITFDLDLLSKILIVAVSLSELGILLFLWRRSGLHIFTIPMLALIYRAYIYGSIYWDTIQGNPIGSNYQLYVRLSFLITGFSTLVYTISIGRLILKTNGNGIQKSLLARKAE